MQGNLDTILDAVIRINSHDCDGSEGKQIAEWIVRKYNSESQQLTQNS